MIGNERAAGRPRRRAGRQRRREPDQPPRPRARTRSPPATCRCARASPREPTSPSSGTIRAIATVIGDTSYKLSSADEKTLRGITPRRGDRPGLRTRQPDIPPTTRDLSDAGGTFLLTAVSDPGGDGAVYITGLPLSTLHDTLRRVALAEAAVFGAVLLLAGAGGTLWVRFSLRPLRRVAATASQVAELPLDSDEVELQAGVPDTDPATETGQVGLAFNRMLGHVQTALRRRAASEARLRRFAADASHELRTPLSAIRGYAELALRHPGDSPEQVTHALGRVLSESTRMSVLVDELLLLARLDAGRPLASEPVDMTRLVIDATSDAQVARPGHRWVLELPDDPVLVSGDEHRLHQVLANVLSNAGKHTPDGATVTVRVGDTLPRRQRGGTAGRRRRRPGRADGPPRHLAAAAPAGRVGHRQRPRHPARPAARPVRAVHQGRHGPVAHHQRLVDRPRPGDRGRRRRRPRRRRPGHQPPGQDQLRHRAPAAHRARLAAAAGPGPATPPATHPQALSAGLPGSAPFTRPPAQPPGLVRSTFLAVICSQPSRVKMMDRRVHPRVHNDPSSISGRAGARGRDRWRVGVTRGW